MNLSSPNALNTASWLQIVQKQVGDLRFGLVQIVIHEGKVVQIEKTEKVRLPSAENPTQILRSNE